MTTLILPTPHDIATNNTWGTTLNVAITTLQVAFDSYVASVTANFDPNEDPVILGVDSSIFDGTNTDTPDSPTSFPRNVIIGADASYVANPADDPEDGTIVIGPGAQAESGRATVLGNGAQVLSGAIGAIAIGASIDRFNPGPTAAHPQDVAIGTNAGAEGNGPGPSAVAIGADSNATGDGAVAIGPSASAEDNTVAVGWGARAAGQPSNGGVAVGSGANAAGPEGTVAIGYAAAVDSSIDRAVAIGANSSLDSFGNDCVALGDHANNNGFESAVAIGSAAQNTRDSQIMLGVFGGSQFAEVDTGYVVTDTDGSGNRWIMQVTGGVFTLSPAP